MADNDNDETSKEPFVGQGDRPELRLRPDTPIGELTVRDLAALLGRLGPSRKDFWDGKDWAKDDFDGPVIKGKDVKDKEKEKDKEKDKDKEKEKEKLEKREKPEIKEVKVEKVETDGVFEPAVAAGPDSRLDEVVRALSGLTEQVAQLADQVEELKNTGTG